MELVNLSQYEKEMLEGKYGKLKKQAIKKVVEYANALGAEKLCKVSKAHLFCGTHLYLDAYKKESSLEDCDIEEVLSEMHLCSKEKLNFEEFECFCQADCGPMDPERYKYLGIEEKRGKLNKQYLEFYANLGVNLAETCVPYMVGFIPFKGEHYVSSESHAVTMMNSFFGACGNSDGLEAGFWSAICGRTPYWGNHIMENRKGTHLFQVDFDVSTSYDWDLLGYTIGRMLPPHSIPVINGQSLNADIFNIKYFFASMATTSGPEMCHIVGLTPEAHTLEDAFASGIYEIIKVTPLDIEKSLSLLSDNKSAKIDLVSLGCPHYSIEELHQIAKYLKNKTIHKDVCLNIWTAPSIKFMSDRTGLTDIIERSNAKLLTSSCPLTSDVFLKEEGKNILFDSAKQAHYIRPLTKSGIYYKSLEKCLEAAILGYV